jgi:hypothetical protein
MFETRFMPWWEWPKGITVVPDYSRSALQLYHDVLYKSSASFCGTISQILSVPAKELQLNDSEL